MKKFLLMIVFLLVVAVTFSACTEEEVTPKEKDTGGATGSAKW
ncbi:MAG: hypothetical protein O9302_00960 [Cyclobacteriaceae bacterium]|jgi:hypothetical protein|nr:hypothetical protein [Cytophagales bacterium]MCZ8326600.1 hypothetical protein [Cyclobacteriaceae bacterium]